MNVHDTGRFDSRSSFFYPSEIANFRSSHCFVQLILEILKHDTINLLSFIFL